MRPIAAGLLMLLPALAGAFEWTGRVGFLYAQTDIWPAAGARVSDPHLDLDLRLDARGEIVSRGVFDWTGGVGYRRLSDSQEGTRTALLNALSYRFRGALFQNRTSPVRLNLFADRTDSSVENLVGGTTVTGNGTVTRYGGAATVRVNEVPRLEMGYSARQTEETFPGSPLRSTDSQRARFAFGHTAAVASVNMRLDGEWNTGSWSADNYDQYIVSADGHSRLSERGDLFFTDQYTQRTATAATGPTFGYDFNAFSVGYRAGMTPGDALLVSYRNVHSLIDTSVGSTENLIHNARYEQDFRFEGSKYFLRPLADLTYREQRLSTGTVTNSGETARVLLWWRDAGDRGRLFEWNAGPAVGLLHVPGEETRLGYGAVAAIRYSGPFYATRASASYEAEWRSDIFGQRGWSLRQQASAGTSGAAAGGAYTFQATASAFRGWTPLGGDQAQRGVQANGTFRRRGYGGDLSLGFSSGASPNVAGVDLVGDGFFLPVGFNFHTFTVAAGANAELLHNLVGRVQLRSTTSSGPGQPSISYGEAGASLSYRYGAFDLSLEDRYQRSLSDDNSIPTNIFMFRVSRIIGTRY